MTPLQRLWRGGAACLVPVAAWAAEPADGAPVVPASRPWSQLSLGLGVRTFELTWASNGAPGNPPFTSTWRDEQALATRLAWSSSPRLPIAFALSAEYDGVIAGRNEHSGFTDDRTTEVYRSENDADCGYLLRIAADVGAHLHLLDGRLLVTPLAGFIDYEQHLVQRSGFQPIPAAGATPDLSSSYDAQWWCPRAVLAVSYEVSRGIRIAARGEYARGTYTGDADWNLRSDLQHPASLTQRAQAESLVAALALTIALPHRLTFAVSGELEGWRTLGGTDVIHRTAGGDQVTSLQTVRLHSSALFIGMSWEF